MSTNPIGKTKASSCGSLTRFDPRRLLSRLGLMIPFPLVRETGGGGAVLDPELRINVLQMFADRRRACPENLNKHLD